MLMMVSIQAPAFHGDVYVVPFYRRYWTRTYTRVVDITLKARDACLALKSRVKLVLWCTITGLWELLPRRTGNSRGVHAECVANGNEGLQWGFVSGVIPLWFMQRYFWSRMSGCARALMLD